MAFAVSDERTVLWDQFEYSGAPGDFSWVLPVLPGATLEASTDAWFEALEAVTKTQVTSPQLSCAQQDSGCGLGSKSFADSAPGSGFFAGGGVAVLHEGTVGPYDTVTLRSTDGAALTDWLTMHGYFIPPEMEPVIADYTKAGDDFIAVRLQPGMGVQQMTPVRVVTPGGEYLLPLRMVAAGAGEKVDIVLYVIGEQRYAMPDLHEVSVDLSKLTWSFANNSNNYAELRRQALAQNLGFSYLPTFAKTGAFGGTLPGPSGGVATFSVSSNSGSRLYSNFADLYFAQALANDGVSPDGCASIAFPLSSSNLVTTYASPTTVAETELDCMNYSDISAALLGMHPSQVWLTRLELDLPKEALSQDCTVVPADSQTQVSNQLLAQRTSDRPSGCEEVVFESKLSRGLPTRTGALMFLSLAAAALWLRRRGGAC